MAIDLRPFKQDQIPELVDQIVHLLSQSRRAFLFGAGCSKCAGLPLAMELTKLILDNLAPGLTKDLLEAVKTSFVGAKNATIEDFLSEIVDHLSIAQRRDDATTTSCMIPIGGKTFTAIEIQGAITEIKSGIAFCIDGYKPKIETHTNMMRAIHRTLPAGKPGVIGVVDYFVMNYDTLIEDALGIVRVSHADGFLGGATGWWQPDAFTQQVEARVVKLHGSIDWCLFDGDVFPSRLRPCLHDGVPHRERVMIWPASTKYRETQRDPYAQMMQLFRDSLRPQEGSELVLTTMGYRFFDSHINIELDRALRESQKRLTVVAFTNEDEPSGQLKRWHEDAAVKEQVRIHANRGFFHGKRVVRATEELPWWRFEVLTRLLMGER